MTKKEIFQILIVAECNVKEITHAFITCLDKILIVAECNVKAGYSLIF